MSLTGHGSRPRYRTLSAVASNVAAAAALAAQQDQVREHQRHGSLVHHGHRGIGSSASLLSREMDEDEEMDHNVMNTLADSFHSEGGRNIGRKRVSWSVERHAGRGGSVGRYSQRQATLHGSDTAAGEQEEFSSSTPTVRHNSLASRQGAGLAFLSVFALFSVGQLVGARTNTGSVVVPRVIPRSDLSPLPVSSVHLHPPSDIDFDQSNSYQLSSHEDAGASYVVVESPENGTLESSSETSNERVIGRLFAWLCTTLYLTSRLPQIWKNFSRKSVEGLSVYLFIFAFLGNFFYVSSILTNPRAHQGGLPAQEFITESIPLVHSSASRLPYFSTLIPPPRYLLGSAGTFIFDVTIVTQVIIYRKRPKASIRRGRRHSRAGQEEESGLLADDTQEYPPYNSSVTTTNESPVHSRDRTSQRTLQ
ncbi:hypothetical protein PQX77_008521 [Marasmius sp. AFHP31]|nr:hypothetical protein PQX77_008521 [Marasmius sp. AFHP31]